MIEVNIVRHAGRPTSGRYVYATLSRRGFIWQDDMCGAPDQDTVFPTMQTAFAAALNHARQCEFVSASRRSI